MRASSRRTSKRCCAWWDGGRTPTSYSRMPGAARAVLGAELGFEHRLPVARVSDPIAIQATPDGAACGFYGAGLVELLRLLVGYEGAMLHVACRAHGGAACEWRAAGPDPRHQ